VKDLMSRLHQASRSISDDDSSELVEIVEMCILQRSWCEIIELSWEISSGTIDTSEELNNKMGKLRALSSVLSADIAVEVETQIEKKISPTEICASIHSKICNQHLTLRQQQLQNPLNRFGEIVKLCQPIAEQKQVNLLNLEALVKNIHKKGQGLKKELDSSVQNIPCIIRPLALNHSDVYHYLLPEVDSRQLHQYIIQVDKAMVDGDEMPAISSSVCSAGLHQTDT